MIFVIQTLYGGVKASGRTITHPLKRTERECDKLKMVMTEIRIPPQFA